MKLIRFQDANDAIRYGSLLPDATVLEVTGDIFGQFEVGSRTVAVKKLLAPIVPPSILCVGLNYRRHAEESKLKAPQWPILFMKGPAALQNPGDPIVLPRHLRSDEVDYE